MNFSEEYTNLENRVVEAFNNKREELVEIVFLSPNTNFDDFDEYQRALENCPTSYYNHKHSGEERHIYITKIDSEGIHSVDSEDLIVNVCIGLNDLNGLYYKIELLEDIEKQLILNREMSDFISKYGVKVEPNETTDYVELMIDDHKCITFEGIEYYIPENSMLFNDEEIEILDMVIELFEIK